MISNNYKEITNIILFLYVIFVKITFNMMMNFLFLIRGVKPNNIVK